MAANWTEIVLGLWIIVSPWLLGFSSISVMKWSNLIVGTILVLINVWIVFGGNKNQIESPRSERK